VDLLRDAGSIPAASTLSYPIAIQTVVAAKAKSKFLPIFSLFLGSPNPLSEFPEQAARC
jgi:hypothetical protein